MSLTIGQSSMAGRKDENEDSYGVLIPKQPLLDTKGAAMVIADGMSGSDAGKEASEMCVKSFLTDYFATSETLTVKTAAGQALSALNRWLHGQGQAVYQSHRGMVSTMSAMVLKSATAHIFHVGDSRISRLRDGQLEHLTKDHRIIVSQDKSFLSRAMGIDLNVDVDYRTVAVEPGDLFVFTTDGVHEHINDADLVALLIDLAGGDDKTADAIAKSITDAAYEHGSTDNLTCQIISVNSLLEEDQNDFLDNLQRLPFPPPLEGGMGLDGYRVVREIHASNRSQVYLAIDEESDARVALKTPSPKFEDDPTYLQLFSREEWVGKRLNSPNVLKVLEPVRRRRFLYSVTEYVEGTTLRQWMDDNPHPGVQEVRELITQIAMGLRAFHRKEMIHQDLKPDNILIDTEGTVKIIDFGSVKVAGLDEIETAPHAPDILGTVDYTAPEYLLGKAPGNSADLFSLGVITYEMLTGHLPYGKGFTNARQVARSTYTPAYEHNDAVPAWVDGALRKAVSCTRTKRYDILSEFLADLRHPNPKLAIPRARPLLEQNPVAFWRGMSLALTAVIIFLIYRLNL
ncbi:MAG: bifunctional protein-serine/threonine kinase/phosphatase [Magnetovibrio sp.]|nr:bifunctional protein-serine/threonine kinase/phosphatase [Magnetovibrio sp.]